ncbi:hypothetical protein AB0M92_23900 [Streptomyces sp. NPDC051582]
MILDLNTTRRQPRQVARGAGRDGQVRKAAALDPGRIGSAFGGRVREG